MARNKDQNEKMREERKEQIRDEALKQFAEKGLVATRISDIAKGVGMAQGLLYHYYPSKDAIYMDLINDAMDKTIEASYHLLEMQASAEEKILFALKELLETIKSSEKFTHTCRLIAQSTNLMTISDESQEIIETKRDTPYQIVAQIMEDGQKEGTVIEGCPRMLAILFWTSINGLAIYCSNHKDEVEIPDYRILAKMFIKTVNHIVKLKER